MRLSILAAFLLGQAAFADTIVSSLSGGTSGSLGGLLAVSWSETTSWVNVSIGVNIAVEDGNPSEEATGTAYLMEQIGSGTTSGPPEEIASAPVSIFGNPGIDTMTSIFSSLSLGPGTYYLVIDPSSVNQINSLDWDGAGTPSETFGAGVSDVKAFAGTTTSASFPPANSFTTDALTPIFDVTGTLSSQTSTVPEPSTTIPIGCARIALTLARWHRSKREPSRQKSDR